VQRNDLAFLKAIWQQRKLRLTVYPKINWQHGPVEFYKCSKIKINSMSCWHSQLKLAKNWAV